MLCPSVYYLRVKPRVAIIYSQMKYAIRRSSKNIFHSRQTPNIPECRVSGTGFTYSRIHDDGKKKTRSTFHIIRYHKNKVFVDLRIECLRYCSHEIKSFNNIKSDGYHVRFVRYMAIGRPVVSKEF